MSFLRPLAVVATFLALVAPAAAQPAHVILIRHAEKDPPLPDDTHTKYLSLAGEARAAALVPYFQKSKDVTALGKIDFVFAQKPKTDKDSVRAAQTVRPFAAANKLPVRTPVFRDDYATLVASLLKAPEYDGKVVLVCWEHDRLEDIAAALVKGRTVRGGPEKFKWPKGRFDRTWVISFDKAGPGAAFRDLPQRLMFGDTPE